VFVGIADLLIRYFGSISDYRTAAAEFDNPERMFGYPFRGFFIASGSFFD